MSINQALQIEIDARATFAEKLARKAGELAVWRMKKRGIHQTEKLDGNIVTDIDIDIELLIRREIFHTYPTDAILGEEQGGPTGERLWIIDPIDGTSNFTRRLPHWCISIAFALNGTPLVGVIFAPDLDEMFVSVAGSGSMLNGDTMKPDKRLSLKAAKIGFGIAASTNPDGTLAVMRRVASYGASIRVQGAGALTLAYIAAGRLDGFYEANLHIWDCAAAIVMLRETGCKFAIKWDISHPQAPFPMTAAAPGIWNDLNACIN